MSMIIEINLGVYSNLFTDLLVQIIAAFIAFLGALCIYYLGVRREKLKSELEEERRLKSLLDFLRVSLELNMRPIQDQIDSITNLEEQLKIKKVIDLHFKMNTTLDFVEWMKSVNFIDLQRAFYLYYPRAEKNTKYSELIKHLLHVKEIKSNLGTGFLEITKQSNKFEKMFNDAKVILIHEIEEAMRTYNSAQYKSMQTEEKLLLEASKFYFQQENIANRNDMYFTYDNLITPLKEVAKKSLDPNLLKGVRDADFAFKSYVKANEFNLRKFSSYKAGLERAAEFFPTIVMELKAIEMR